MTGIYKITNLVTQKHYIGQAVNIEKRWKEHCRRVDQYIDQSIHKYGIDNFSFTILEECPIEKLNEREDYWIKYYNSIVPNGYNIGFCHNTSYGEFNGNNKLINEDVIQMRQIYASRQYTSETEIWEKYFKNKISYSRFVVIFRGDAWCHIMPEVFTEENNDYYSCTERWNWMHKQNGENNCRAILKEEDVIRIRALYVTKERKDLFKIFPEFTERTIVSVISGQNWKYLPIYEKRKGVWKYPEKYSELDKQKWLERIKEICLK